MAVDAGLKSSKERRRDDAPLKVPEDEKYKLGYGLVGKLLNTLPSPHFYHLIMWMRVPMVGGLQRPASMEQGRRVEGE